MEHLKEQHYPSINAVPEHKVLERATEILSERLAERDAYTSPDMVKTFLKCKLGGYEREVFSVMFLDNGHRLISYQELFFGTINAASVYPREVVKAALKFNAAAVIFSHNHPSGVSEPSKADIAITSRLKETLALVDVRALDHIIVGDTCTSMAQRGLF